MISLRTKLALQAAKRRGVVLGTRNPVRQVAVMAEANRRQRRAFAVTMLPVVREIQGTGVRTLQGIAEAITRRGYPTRQGKKLWRAQTVKDVLAVAA